MTTIDEILEQPDNFSQLSIDASFTLEDILQQPADKEIQLFDDLANIDIDNLSNYFEDDDLDAMFEP